ncbi:MAG: M23 family metallopeptidase [Prevotellaceae bacterium]|nr:M23 family metallopeptidase [Prevotellaceae bacterium]
MKNFLSPFFFAACCAFTASTTTAFAPPMRYYAPPMAYPISLSANFGELRPAHLHSGVDLRTGGVEGEPVFAVADGYIARIGIRSLGYGNALYLAHSNGTTSVYAHLKSFTRPVAKHLRKAQYARQSFVIDVELDSTVFPLKQGDLIGFSGNSGNSFGPHLHFEIRDREQRPFNVMLHGFYQTLLPDTTPPQASVLMAYRLDTVQGVAVPVRSGAYDIATQGHKLSLLDGDTIEVDGATFFGLDLLDRMSGNTENTYGVSHVELRVDDSITLAYAMQIFGFDETRYCNAMLDFDERQRSGRTVVKLYVAPNNRLSIYDPRYRQGLLTLPDSGLAKVSIVLDDDAGNRSTLQFWAHAKAKPTPASLAATGEQAVLSWDMGGRFTAEGFSVDIPAGVMYDHSRWELQVLPAAHGSASPIYAVMQPTTPPHRAVSVRIAADIAPRLQAHAVVVCMDGKGRKSVLATTCTASGYTADSRSWGSFFVLVDTVAPSIKPLNFAAGKKLTQPTISLRVKDNLSELKRYAGYVDGRWALFEYDEKNNLFHHTLDAPRANRRHTISFTATDVAGNEGRGEWVVKY